jgi:uncharacterized membrane protein YgdD (TMEM256/DUF423 family)
MSRYGSMAKLFLVVGALLGGSAVGAGAFSTHALRAAISDSALSLIKTAAQYQMYHALALLAVGLLYLHKKQHSLALNVSGCALITGALGFSGSLYGLGGLGADSPVWIGLLTPIGGLFLLIGWSALAIAAFNLESS